MTFIPSLGGGELIAIFVVTLILFGPHRLPEIARLIGRWYARMYRALVDFQRQLMEEIPPLDPSDRHDTEGKNDSLFPPNEPPPAG